MDEAEAAVRQAARQAGSPDLEVLDHLEGIRAGQRLLLEELQTGGQAGGTWLAYLAGHYQALPPGVARRLSEVDGRQLIGPEGLPIRSVSGPNLKEVIQRVASPAARAQVSRAVNLYRERLGLPQLEV